MVPFGPGHDLGKAPPGRLRCYGARAGCSGIHYGTNPTSETNHSSTNEDFKALNVYRFSAYRIRQAPPRNGWRGRPARERGLNENTFMVLVLELRRKRADGPGFA